MTSTHLSLDLTGGPAAGVARSRGAYRVSGVPTFGAEAFGAFGFGAFGTPVAGLQATLAIAAKDWTNASRLAATDLAASHMANKGITPRPLELQGASTG